MPWRDSFAPASSLLAVAFTLTRVTIDDYDELGRVIAQKGGTIGL